MNNHEKGNNNKIMKQNNIKEITELNSSGNEQQMQLEEEVEEN